jgi:hypothetical protein
MSSPELDALIIEHLADLDRAAKRISLIEHALFSAMNARAEGWAKRKGWTGKFKIPENGGWDDWDIWLAPTEWGNAADESDADFDFCFAPEVGAGDTEGGKAGEAWNYVTRLCGLEGGQIGFRFVKPSAIGKRKWQGIVDQYRGPISSTRFILDSEPSFFLGFRIDPAALAAALRDDDPNAALGPFEAALDALFEARPVFDRLVEQLRAEKSRGSLG